MTPPSPTFDTDALDLDAEPVELPPLPEPRDPRWICWKCGGLALLDDDGLCNHCWPEQVLTFAEVCGWAFTGDEPDAERRWWIR